MKIEKFKLNPNNPRTITDRNLRKLQKSIKEFPEMMEKRPMVCVTDPDDGLLYPIGGNMRLQAIKALGTKDIPKKWFVVADEWTEDQRKEFVIKDNVSMGAWDLDMLGSWDAEKLNEWGVEIPFEEMEQEDMDSKYDNSNCEYPLIPIYDEKYRAFIIICESETEEAGIRTKFNFPDRAQSYKNSFLGTSNVLRAKDIL